MQRIEITEGNVMVIDLINGKQISAIWTEDVCSDDGFIKIRHDVIIDRDKNGNDLHNEEQIWIPISNIRRIDFYDYEGYTGEDSEE